MSHANDSMMLKFCNGFVFASKSFIVCINSSMWAITWCGWSASLIVTSASEILSLKIFSSSFDLLPQKCLSFHIEKDVAFH